jgi:hypothetical protein
VIPAPVGSHQAEPVSYRVAVRPSKTVAGAVLSALLALAAVPGLARTGEEIRDQGLDAAAFQSVIGARPGWVFADEPPDPAMRSDGYVADGAQFIEPGESRSVPAKPAVKVRAATSTWSWKDPRYTLTGDATYYNAGYTAMRLPRGTVVVICGKAACIERVISDYGPITESRIVDLYKPDFFEVCGCEWWEGVTPVTVRVY